MTLESADPKIHSFMTPEARVLEASSEQAYREVREMKVPKSLPSEQQTAIRRLVRELVLGEMSASEGIKIELSSRHSALMVVKEALQAGVPREVLLAAMDRPSLEYRTPSQTSRKA